MLNHKHYNRLRHWVRLPAVNIAYLLHRGGKEMAVGPERGDSQDEVFSGIPLNNRKSIS